MMFTDRSLARGAFLLALCLLGACSSSAPDKRVLQYLNEEGFGNRYTGNAEEENYITIGDSIEMSDAYHPELDLISTVDIDGTIILPEVGAVFVAGKTRTELEAFLVEKYSPYYEQLDITVRINALGKVYFIFGEVNGEGEQPFDGDLTLFEAVMNAAPDDRTANLGRVLLIRPDPRDPYVQPFNVKRMMTTGDSTFNTSIQERDIIFVPPTLLAQFGYFLADLLFPITNVINEVGRAVFVFDRGFTGGFGGGRGRRRRGNANTIF